MSIRKGRRKTLLQVIIMHNIYFGIERRRMSNTLLI
ncbi:unnamed protein product [Amoebophrya sp. A25]|nr:unnamed protein product [Amoebophrya sp. A25]|eukprot:GSA25T00001811001.1